MVNVLTLIVAATTLVATIIQTAIAVRDRKSKRLGAHDRRRTRKARR